MHSWECVSCFLGEDLDESEKHVGKFRVLKYGTLSAGPETCS